MNPASTFNNPFVAQIVLDEKLRVTSANDLASLYILEKNSAEDLKLKYFFELFSPLDKKTWNEHLKTAAQTGKTFDLTLKNQKNNSSEYRFFVHQQNTQWVLFFMQLDLNSENAIKNKLEQIKKDEESQLDLRLELKMSDLALERKSYELALIRELLSQIKHIQDYDEIIQIFIKFICEKFLMPQSFFIKLFTDAEARGHIASSYSMAESPNLGGIRQIFFKIISENHQFFTKPRSYIREPIPDFLNQYFQIKDKKLTGVLHLPIQLGHDKLGVLHFGHYAPHHGLSEDDLKLIDLLLEQIEPFIENSKLFEMSMIDDLTQVYNKRYFKQTAEREFKKGKSNPDIKMSLIILDIDHFKKVNDTFGHIAGDKVLQEFGKILKYSARDKDIVCRYGGEEFAILLTEPLKVANMLANRIREKIHNTVIDFGSNTHHKVTSSFGISVFDPSEDSLEKWIERTDHCLYEAKRAGRDRIVIDPVSLKKEPSE